MLTLDAEKLSVYPESSDTAALFLKRRIKFKSASQIIRKRGSD